jgi:hypothetical protein
MRSLPVCSGGGAAGGSGVNEQSFLGAESDRIIHVAKHTDSAQDGTRQHPYKTIAAGYAAAKLLTPSVNKPVAVLIYPGYYDEEVDLDTSYIDLIGVGGRAGTILSSDTSTPLVVSADNVTVQGLTIDARDAFDIIQVASGVTEVLFYECKTTAIDSASCFIDISAAGTGVTFQDCHLTTGDDDINVLYAQTTAECTLWNCRVSGRVQAAQATLKVRGCIMAADGNTLNLTNALGAIMVQSNIIRSTGTGQAINTTATIQGPVFVDNWINGGDTVSFDGATDANTIIRGNRLSAGLDAGVKFSDPLKRIGGYMDWYADANRCENSWTSDWDFAQLYTNDITYFYPNNGQPWILDGIRRFSLIYAASVTSVYVNAGAELLLQNIITGKRVQVAGNGSDFHLKHVEHNGEFYISASAGGGIRAEHCTFNNSSNVQSGHAVEYQGAVGYFTLDNCTVIGNTAAVDFNANTYDQLKAKYSEFWRTDDIANDAFIGVAGIDYAAHHCAFPTNPGANFTNLVTVGEYDSFDTDALY